MKTWPIIELLSFPPSPFDAKNPFLAVVTTNRKLNQGTERHLMHLELDISDSKIRYQLLPLPLPHLHSGPPALGTGAFHPPPEPYIYLPLGMNRVTMWLFTQPMTLPWSTRLARSWVLTWMLSCP